jgi:lipopolysaccharide export system protein LptA
MSKQFFIISTLFLLFSAIDSFSAEQQKAKLRGPVTVTSESLTADNKSHTAFFDGNVVAKTNDITIYADRMLVFYNESGGEITKIDATGNVKLLKDNRVIFAGQAVYFADEDKVVFTGEPRAVDGDNVVTGSKMTYFVTEDRSLVDNSKVFLKNKKDR